MGVETAKVRNWWAERTPRERAAGATLQPIFQPVSEKVFPSEDRLTVRCHIPGRLARRTCSPSNTSRSYTSSVIARQSRSMHRDAISSSSARVNTRPVGLWGVFTRIARVRSVKAARSSASSMAKSGGRSVTKRGTAPAMARAAR